MKKLIAASVVLLVLGSGLATAKVIGKINGYPVTERAANAFLKVVTKGKLKFHQLRPKDKKDVVKRIAVDALLTGLSRKSIPELERNQVIVNYWLVKKIKNVSVSDEAINKAYTSNKKFFKDTEGNILPFEKVKEMIAVSLKQKKYVAQLMTSARITMGKKVIQSPKKSKSSEKKKEKSTTTAVSPEKTKTLKVKSGNTLSGIAHKYHITTKQLRELNGMTKKDTLKIGQNLKVPGK